MRSRSAFRLTLAVLALAAGALVGPLPAQAAPAHCQAPPGTSGIDQYCETVPSATGDQGTRGGGRGQSGRSGTSVSQRTAAALRRSGASGKAILGLSSGSGQGSNSGTSGGNAAKGSTGGSTGAGSHGRGATQGSQATAPAGRSDNPLEAIRSGVTSGGSAGPGFVWILVILGAIMAGLGWLRYRRSTSN